MEQQHISLSSFRLKQSEIGIHYDRFCSSLESTVGKNQVLKIILIFTIFRSGSVTREYF